MSDIFEHYLDAVDNDYDNSGFSRVSFSRNGYQGGSFHKKEFTPDKNYYHAKCSYSKCTVGYHFVEFENLTIGQRTFSKVSLPLKIIRSLDIFSKTVFVHRKTFNNIVYQKFQ